jgi:hypothetical protein
LLQCKTDAYSLLVGIEKLPMKKVMSKTRTVTFQPTPDLAPLLEEVKKRGRGVQSHVINKALRKGLTKAIKEWERYRGPSTASPFNRADAQPSVSLAV